MIEIDNIYLGDCLEVMKDIPDNTCDMVLCDLPYGVLNRANKNVKWDNVIPLDKLWEQYARIVKDKGNIVLFAQDMFTAKLLMSKPEWHRYNLVWDKCYVTGFLDANRKPLRQHEDICIFTNGGGYASTYNPQKTRSSKRHKIGGNGIKNSCYGNLQRLPTQETYERYPTSILTFSKEDGTRHYHPTTKPVDLLRWLILTYSNENDVVLDNCMGSGSTCVAAIKEKRHYIGIEIEEKYFNVAKQRINEEKANLTLF